MEGLVGASSHCGGVFPSPLASLDSEPIRQNGIFGSGFHNQRRSGELEGHQWRNLKMARTEAPSLLRSTPHLLFSYGEQMCNFSLCKQDALLRSSEGTLPYYNNLSAEESVSSSSSESSYVRSAGLGSGGLNANVNWLLSGPREPFTPSQWMELKQQALIYKCIEANVPIPPNLLISFRNGLSDFSSGSLRPTTLNWGPFQPGLSGNVDPEPGRCRRTDGKKWRCSRDAVADQKYCERHINRGRHRSRKPVEGHTSHAAKVMPNITPLPSTSAVSGSGLSTSLTVAQRQMENLQPSIIHSSPTQLDRMVVRKENVTDQAGDSQNLSMLTSGLRPLDTLFPVLNQPNPFEGTSSLPDFGLTSDDSLLSLPTSSFLENNSFLSSMEPQPLGHCVDDWSQNQSECSTVTWPYVGQMQADKTHPSISLPMASSDLSSSSSSPIPGNLTLSPLLSQEFDPFHMGSIGMGQIRNEVSWDPISWVASVGGPLGEVLTNNNTTIADSSSSLNLISEEWDLSPELSSSPTNVNQKIGSVSTSTTVSVNSLGDHIFGSTHVNSPTFPSP